MRKSIIDAKVIEPNVTPIPYRDKDLNVYDYIPFGGDNLFPQALAFFARSSPNHRGLINGKTTYFLGEGIRAVDDSDKKLTEWLDTINSTNVNINVIQEKLFLDENMTGNAWLEIITDIKRSFIHFNHIDATKCRKSKDEKRVIIHPDWNNDTGANDLKRISLPLYPNFEPDKNNAKIYRSVFHKFSYEPEFTYYGLPSYIAGRDSIQIDIKTNRWNLSKLKNSFRLSGILIVPVKDETESKLVIDNISKNFTGEENANKLMTITKSRAMDNEKADQTQFIPTESKDDGSWMDLHKQSLSDIVVAHNWFRALTAIPDNTGFDTQRILNEYQVALNTVIDRAQKSWIDLYRKIVYEVSGMEIDIQFTNKPPVNDYRYYKIWEVRKSKGLDYDENAPEQQEIIR